MIEGMVIIILSFYYATYPVLQGPPLQIKPALKILFHGISIWVCKNPCSKKMPA
jgi:hypothetical protein